MRDDTHTIPQITGSQPGKGELFMYLSSHKAMLVFKSITGMLKCRPDIMHNPYSRTS